MGDLRNEDNVRLEKILMEIGSDTQSCKLLAILLWKIILNIRIKEVF